MIAVPMGRDDRVDIDILDGPEDRFRVIGGIDDHGGAACPVADHIDVVVESSDHEAIDAEALSDVHGARVGLGVAHGSIGGC